MIKFASKSEATACVVHVRFCFFSESFWCCHGRIEKFYVLTFFTIAFPLLLVKTPTMEANPICSETSDTVVGVFTNNGTYEPKSICSGTIKQGWCVTTTENKKPRLFLPGRRMYI